MPVRKTSPSKKAKKKVSKKKAPVKKVSKKKAPIKKASPKPKPKSKATKSVAPIDYTEPDDDLPSSAEIESNEKLLDLERKAGFQIDGKRKHKNLTEQNRGFLGQLAWYWKLKGKTYQEIADKYDVSVGIIFRLFQETAKATQEFVDGQAEYFIMMQLLRLEQMYEAIEPFSKEHLRTEIVTRRYREKLLIKEVQVKTAPSLDAVSTILKIMDRQAKLLGLDKPAKTELEVTDKQFVMYGPEKSSTMDTWSKTGNVVPIGKTVEKGKGVTRS